MDWIETGFRQGTPLRKKRRLLSDSLDAYSVPGVKHSQFAVKGGVDGIDSMLVLAFAELLSQPPVSRVPK